MRNAATDLTEGTPWKIIMRFSIPLFFTFLLQQFYNMVDTIVVGQFLGKDALAGVGSTGAINFMIIGFCDLPMVLSFRSHSVTGQKIIKI